MAVGRGDPTLDFGATLARLRGLADATLALLSSLAFGLLVLGLFLLLARVVRTTGLRAPSPSLHRR